MPLINTLVKDIYSLLQTKNWMTPELAQWRAEIDSQRLMAHFNEEQEARLRLSQMGPKCPRELWYSVNAAELAEPLQPWTINKFAYGHMIESYALMLVKASGHSLEGMQDAVTVDGVTGHRDAVVDGCLVDVKSCNSLSFEKFKTRRIAEDDSFGYLDQLDGYSLGGLDDPLIRVKDKSYILAVDQVKGHIHLYEHINRPSISERIKKYKEITSLNKPPACTCQTVEDGKSGNIKLGVKASYSRFKWECFPNLRCFIYSDGPRYLTKVVREPREDVPEVDKHGNYISRHVY